MRSGFVALAALVFAAPRLCEAKGLGDARTTLLQMAPEAGRMPAFEVEAGLRLANKTDPFAEVLVGGEWAGLELGDENFLGRLFVEAAVPIGEPLNGTGFRAQLTPFRQRKEMPTVALAWDVHWSQITVQRNFRFDQDLELRIDALEVGAAAFLPAVETNDFDVEISAALRFPGFHIFDPGRFVGISVGSVRGEVRAGLKTFDILIISLFLAGSADFSLGWNRKFAVRTTASRIFGFQARFGEQVVFTAMGSYFDAQFRDGAAASIVALTNTLRVDFD